jgi:hypothetical protein
VVEEATGIVRRIKGSEKVFKMQENEAISCLRQLTAPGIFLIAFI